jgi:hypothetical protein
MTGTLSKATEIKLAGVLSPAHKVPATIHSNRHNLPQPA